MIAAAAASGNHLAALQALRDRLAGDLDDCNSARDVAALSQRLMDVLGQIDVITRADVKDEKGTPLDELRKRRAARAANS